MNNHHAVFETWREKTEREYIERARATPSIVARELEKELFRQIGGKTGDPVSLSPELIIAWNKFQNEVQPEASKEKSAIQLINEQMGVVPHDKY